MGPRTVDGRLKVRAPTRPQSSGVYGETSGRSVVPLGTPRVPAPSNT